MFESLNVCTRSMSRRGRGRPKGGWSPKRKKRERKYTTKGTNAQTEQVGVTKLPSLRTWAVKKKRSTSCSAQFVYPLPSTIAGAYPRQLTCLEPCSFLCQTGIQNGDKESAIICTDEVEGPNTPPQPNMKKRKVNCLIDLPVYKNPIGERFYRVIFPQPSFVGNCDSSEFKNQGSEIVYDSENTNGSQHFLVNYSPNTELFEPNGDWRKALTNSIDESVDTAFTNNDVILDISTQASDDDICPRKMSQPLICVGISRASALPIEGTDLICYENITDDPHLVVNVSPEEQLYDSNDDCCKMSWHLNNENVDPASINEDLLHSSNSASIASQRKAGSKNLSAISGLLTSPAWQNNIQNQLIAGNVVPDLCMHESGGHSKKQQTNSLTPELSSTAASPTLGDNDALQDQTLHLQCRSGLLATEQEHGCEIDLNKVPTQKPKRKHRPKILKDVTSVKMSRSKIQVNSSTSKLPKGKNSKEKQTNLLTPDLSSTSSSPTLVENGAFQDQTLHLQPKSGLLAVEQEHGHEIDLNKVPTQKPRKRRHRPKILKDVSFVKKSRSKIQVNSTTSRLPKGINLRGNQCQAKTPTFNKEVFNNSKKLDSFHSMTNVNSTTNGEMSGSSEVLRFQSDGCQNRVSVDSVQNKCNNKELTSHVAIEQAKLMLGTFRNHVRSIDEGFSKNSSSAISRKKRKANLKVLARKKKKSKLKDLARKKFTISEKHTENEENASALTMQILSTNPLVKFKGKRSPRKKLVGSQNAESNLCPINPTALCTNRSAMTSDTAPSHWQGIRVGFQSQKIDNLNNNEHALCADILCLCEKNTHEQGHKMSPEHIIHDCQNRGKFLDILDAIQERLKSLTFDEDQVYATQLHNRKEMIPLKRKDDLIPSAECLALIPYEASLGTMKIKKFRPKVLLNSETKIEFNLLTGKGGVENETYDEKEKLNQERNIFKNRAESFIACMRILQGNRQFSPWKGSVVDSVVGAFLTQNVSDHLSSSAFISLASRFPYVENTKFHGETTPSDLGLSIELPQNPRSSLLDKDCESTILRMHITVPDVSVASIEKQAENETRNVKFHREMTLEEVGFNIELPETPTRRLPDKVCETNLLQRHDTTPELCKKCVQDDTIENGMGSTTFQVEIPQEDLGLGGKPQVLPDILQSDETIKLDDGWRSVTVEMTNERLMRTHSEHNHDHSHAREEPSYVKKICYHSLGQALPYVFHQRSFQERKQAYAVSNCQCSSVASDAPIHDFFGLKIPKHPRSNRRPGSTKDPISRANHIKNLISRTFHIRDSISKTSGISRAAMEMTRGSGKKKLDWESIKKNAKEFNDCAVKKERCPNSNDSVNWDAVRCADLEDIADAIKDRGMNNVLAGRIKSFLVMLHTEHGSIDLEWLKDLSPNDAKNFLLNVRGMGIKSVECIRLLTLQQLAFPVDTNVARIVVRLGWVPLAPLPESLLIHKLEEYPYLNSIHQYLWPRLCTLDQRTLYELHYQLITFGKVFCQKSRPNCNACPMKLNCKHFASAFASAQQALPAPVDKSLSMPISSFDPQSQKDSYPLIPLALPPISSFNILSQQNPYTLDLANISVRHISTSMPNCEPIIEEPLSPEHESIDSSVESAPHDSFDMDSEEIPTINLNCVDNALQIYKSSESGTQHYATDTSTALVVAPPESASIPLPKLKNFSRLRTEHQVYEIPDNHQLLSEFDPREPDDPCSYLLAIWSPGEKVERVITPNSCCILNGSDEYQCKQESCRSCTTTRDINNDIVMGTVLIPCKTAMRGRFPLNGTYFQVNEVFADHRTSLHPIEVPRNWIWNLRRCTVYFSTSIPSIFRGLGAEAIQECFWKGYVCVRGFERKTRAPRPLVVRLHFPSSRKDKDQDNDVKYKKEGRL